MGSDNFRFAFMGIAILGFVCCLDRSDYNVVLGLFSFIMWNQVQFPQKHRIIWLNLLAILGDILWIVIISIAQWNQQQLEQGKIRGTTQIFAIANMIYKMILVFYAINWIEYCNDLFSCNSFKTKVLYL